MTPIRNELDLADVNSVKEFVKRYQDEYFELIVNNEVYCGYDRNNIKKDY
ncbi:hypothetical protein ACQKMI_15375 [Lysinibacillus sp. NPDC097214]